MLSLARCLCRHPHDLVWPFLRQELGIDFTFPQTQTQVETDCWFAGFSSPITLSLPKTCPMSDILADIMLVDSVLCSVAGARLPTGARYEIIVAFKCEINVVSLRKEFYA